MNPFLEWLAGAFDARPASVPLLLARLTALLAVAWLLDAALRARNPRWRVLTWRITAAGAALLGGLALCPPMLIWAVLPASFADKVVDERFEVRVTDFGGGRSEATPASTTPVADSSGGVPADESGAAVSGVANGNLPRASQGQVDRWLAIWCAGVILGLLRMTIGLSHLRRIRHRTTAVSTGIDSEAALVASGLGLAKACEIRRTEDLQSPCLVGLWRPLILLPAPQCDLDCRDELPSILAHELAHLKGFDLGWNALLQGLSIGLWFHPLMWRARASHADACDSVADALAADYVGATLYGRTLARLTLRIVAPEVAVGMAMARKSCVQQRIEALRRQVFRTGLSRRRVGGTVIAAMTAIFALGSVTLTHSPAAQRPASAAADREQKTAEANSEGGQAVGQTHANTPERPAAGPRGATQGDREGASTISGTCVDENKNPLADVDVVLYRRDSRLLRVVRIREARTDAQGGYRFADLAVPEKGLPIYVTVATARGRVSRLENLNAPKEQTLIMPAAATLRGRVTDPEGKPVAGAWVWTQAIGDAPLVGFMSSQTDENGQYELTDIAPIDGKKLEGTVFGRSPIDGMPVRIHDFGVSLRVRHPDFAHHVARYNRAPGALDVRLSYGGTIEGRVVDAVTGKPAANVDVILRSIEREKGDNWRQAQTNDQGVYTVTGLGPARYCVWPVVDDRTCVALDSFEVVERQTRPAPELRLIEGGWIEGRIVGPGVQPLSQDPETGYRLQIFLNGPSRPGKRRGFEEACDVDDDGRFRIRVAPGRNFPSLLSSAPKLWERTERKDEFEKGIEVQEGETIQLLFRVLPEKSPAAPGQGNAN